MSDLNAIEELLGKACLCHDSSNLRYALESMPTSIKQPAYKSGCDCKHGQEKSIKKALRQFKTFIETKARFKVGDRVELAETPVITERISYGWLGSKHFLIEGATATIRDVNFHGNEFGYEVMFDNESWQEERTGIIHPTKSRHYYYFREKSLRPIGSIGKRSCAFLKSLWNDFYRIGD